MCKPNLQKWVEYQSQNPLPEQLYTVQVNSFEDLKKRIELVRDQAGKMNERVKVNAEGLERYRQRCDEELQGKIEDARKKNEVIVKKMIQVYGKFEEYLSQVQNGGRSAGIYKAEHDALNEKYQQ